MVSPVESPYVLISSNGRMGGTVGSVYSGFGALLAFGFEKVDEEEDEGMGGGWMLRKERPLGTLAFCS